MNLIQQVDSEMRFETFPDFHNNVVSYFLQETFM